MSNQVTKNQHYIPQSLLKHFSDDGKLFEVLTQNKKVLPIVVGKVIIGLWENSEVKNITTSLDTI